MLTTFTPFFAQKGLRLRVFFGFVHALLCLLFDKVTQHQSTCKEVFYSAVFYYRTAKRKKDTWFLSASTINNTNPNFARLNNLFSQWVAAQAPGSTTQGPALGQSHPNPSPPTTQTSQSPHPPSTGPDSSPATAGTQLNQLGNQFFRFPHAQQALGCAVLRRGAEPPQFLGWSIWCPPGWLARWRAPGKQPKYVVHHCTASSHAWYGYGYGFARVGGVSHLSRTPLPHTPSCLAFGTSHKDQKHKTYWPLYMIVASVSGPRPILGPQRGWGSAILHPRSRRHV